MELNQVSEFMTTEEIFEAWDGVVSYSSTILKAVNNRLGELNYDEDSYSYGSNREIEKLLEIRDTLEDVLDTAETLNMEIPAGAEAIMSTVANARKYLGWM